MHGLGEVGVPLSSPLLVGNCPVLLLVGSWGGILPADSLGDVSEDAVLGSGLQPQLTHGLWDDDVVGGILVGDAAEGGEALHGGLPALCLVGAHSADGLPQDDGWVVEVEGAPGVVEVGALLEVVDVVLSGAEEGASDGDLLGVDDDDLLAAQQLLGYN